MEQILIDKDLIPLDKSWIIRMGFLDLMNGYDDILIFLNKQKDLNDDLLSLKRVCETWKTQTEINVGEGATLYRLLKFASWKYNLNKIFILEGTLKNRSICNDQSIVNLSLDGLLKIDKGTSQWASAAVLLGNKEKVQYTPFKLQVTYDALEHWKKAKEEGGVWKPRYDKTILNQAQVFIKLYKGEKVKFVPLQAEDYCFARMFSFITKEEGEKKWSQLHDHESDRLEEMENVIKSIKENRKIVSRDHRVIQAAALYQKLHKLPSTIIYTDSVNKSWPQFWKFLKQIETL